MKYDLTGNLIFFRPVPKVKYIKNCKGIFDFKHMGLFLVHQGGRDLECYRVDSPREELLVLNARAVFCWFLFFLNYFSHKKKLKAQSLSDTEIYKN